MRILYLAQWLATRDQPGLSRASEFARVWSRAGHEVRVIAGCVDHLTLRSQNPRPAPFARSVEHVDGFRVERVWSTVARGRDKWQRAGLFGSYGLTAGVAGALGPVPDVIYASSPPTSVGLVGAALARRFGVPLFYEMRDLWPDMLLAYGMLRPGLGERMVRRLERGCRQRASGLVTVTAGDAESLKRCGLPASRIRVVPHGKDDWMTPPTERTRPEGPFRCVYVGSHSPMHALGDLVSAAAQLPADQFSFRLIGDGDEHDALRARATKLGLRHVRFEPTLGRRDAFRAMVDADACLVCSHPHPHATHWLPNKVFEYLAAGTPIVAAATGELAALLRRSQAAVVVPPGKPSQLAAALRRLAGRNFAFRADLGAKGSRFVRQHYDRTAQAAALLEWMEDRAQPCADRA